VTAQEPFFIQEKDRLLFSKARPGCTSNADQGTAGIAGGLCDDKPAIGTGNDPGEDEEGYWKYHCPVGLPRRPHPV